MIGRSRMHLLPRAAFLAPLVMMISNLSAQEARPVVHSGSAAQAEVWLCPPGQSVFELMSAEAKWAYSKSRLTGLKLYIGMFNKAKPEDLAQLARFVKEQGYKIAVECGGTLNHDWQDQAGEKSAQVELQSIAKWYHAGGKVDYLDLDGPVRRLLGYSGWGRDPGKKFVSAARCSDELMDYMSAVNQARPEIKFFLLTNFPNWGYRGDVSYHGRGPRKQDQGDYHDVVTSVLAAAKATGTKLAGVTVDNPYEYAIGSHRSVKLADPSAIDWIGRIRTYEDFCRENDLEFNLIINSEQGGKTSDKAFFERTLKFLDRYRAAGGAPTRYFVQSWYEFPKTIVPELEEYSMTALAKAVLKRLQGE